MSYTLAEARTRVQMYLDDDGTRWTTAEIDNMLRVAVDQVIREYTAAGGNRFDISASLSSTAAGLISLASLTPVVVRGLTLVVGSRHFPISETSPEERNVLDDTIRSFMVRYVRSYPFPTNTGHPLIGDGASVAPGSWEGLEHLAMLRAAILLSTKDAEPRQELVAQEQVARDLMMVDPPTPKAARFPGPGHWYSGVFAWVWRPDLQSVQIVRKT